ncbi:hypothetical protein GGS24DRAFT_479244 [Hypoxylon argillaceum]|nr:hypothetical protein GGS24DRAFT_479244 [Hypoxylon argillaceum]
MGRPPAYIFVVRHGRRLDAADNHWHLTSPTPYDPPLTYGGWVHSRTVGARIASILQDEAIADLPSEASTSSPPLSSQKRRRFRIVLHSSPFLRCVQTSIAIAAGLASDPDSSSASSSQQKGPATPTQASSFSNHAPTKTQPDAHVSAPASFHPNHGHDHDRNVSSNSSKHGEKSVLRLDPFLGEWLCPEYFEHITPPPKSALMLATAKAELLRRSSYHEYPHFHVRVHSSTSSHLWNNISGTPSAQDSYNTSVFDTLPQVADSLPDHEAAGSNGRGNGHLDPKGATGTPQGHHQTSGYVFPVPAYALSTSEPIPRGYVAHARDACVAIDYQWDSSRDDLHWGDGGTLPEEWASMHQRFRRGLRRMVDWYSSTEHAATMVTRTSHPFHLPEPDCAEDNDDDGETEDVVVLVSHGAGCNALIGALTQQPVLADVAMSSLTMAKRRAGFDSRNISLTREKSLSSLDAALHTSRATMPEMYEMKLFANTDHLSSTSSSASHSRSASSARSNGRARPSAGYTSALKQINFGSMYGNSSGNGDGHSSNTSLSSRRRPLGVPSLVMGPSIYNANTGGITVGSGQTSFSGTRPDRSGSGTWGLWSPVRNDTEQEKDPETPMFLDFSHEKTTKDEETKEAKEAAQKEEGPTALLNANEPAYTTVPLNEKSISQAFDQNKTLDHHDEEHDDFDEYAVPSLWGGTGNGGLWGTPRPPGEAERIRDFTSSKRRWTVTER